MARGDCCILYMMQTFSMLCSKLWPWHNLTFIWKYKLVYMDLLTTSRDSEALKDTHRVSQNEISEKLIANTDGAGQKGLSNISNSKVDQDPVQRVLELLEFSCGHQYQAIGEDWCNNHKYHPQRWDIVHPSGSNVVVRALKGICKKTTWYYKLFEPYNVMNSLQTNSHMLFVKQSSLKSNDHTTVPQYLKDTYTKHDLYELSLYL